MKPLKGITIVTYLITRARYSCVTNDAKYIVDLFWGDDICYTYVMLLKQICFNSYKIRKLPTVLVCFPCNFLFTLNVF